MTYEDFFAERGLRELALASILSSKEARSLERLIYWPSDSPSDNTLYRAIEALQSAHSAPPENYLPLLAVDDSSIACIVCHRIDEPQVDNEPIVVRWHLDDIDSRWQGSVLDTDVRSYLQSVSEETLSREKSLENVRTIAQKYQAAFVDEKRRPKGTDLRPIQLACQNVIVALAALRHDTAFDGLRVSEYLTCEAPHLATNEANRAMAALLLCDAFQNGGTMEVRFGERNRELPIPPALLRFCRTLGLEIGAEDPAAITPSEARELFLAVTPMPASLRARSFDLIDRGLLTPERLCYLLMSGVWKPIELDFLIATSERVPSILQGGAHVEMRRYRLPEIESCRAAVMLGMLYKRLDNQDGAGQAAEQVRSFEDNSAGVTWTIHEELGAVAITSDMATLPWLPSDRKPIEPPKDGLLIVLPRGLPTPADCALVEELQDRYEAAVVTLLLAADMLSTVPFDCPVLCCPERLGEIDGRIERRLISSRIGRS